MARMTAETDDAKDHGCPRLRDEKRCVPEPASQNRPAPEGLVAQRVVGDGLGPHHSGWCSCQPGFPGGETPDAGGGDGVQISAGALEREGDQGDTAWDLRVRAKVVRSRAGAPVGSSFGLLPARIHRLGPFSGSGSIGSDEETTPDTGRNQLRMNAVHALLSSEGLRAPVAGSSAGRKRAAKDADASLNGACQPSARSCSSRADAYRIRLEPRGCENAGRPSGLKVSGPMRTVRIAGRLRPEPIFLEDAGMVFRTPVRARFDFLWRGFPCAAPYGPTKGWCAIC